MVRIRRKVSIIKLFSSKGEIEAFKKLQGYWGKIVKLEGKGQKLNNDYSTNI